MTKLKKVYYQLKLSQISPLRIGNGENDISDNDLMCDSRGIPFIPGSSMAGVLREKYEKLGGKDPEKLFGIIKNDEATASNIIISDAICPQKICDNVKSEFRNVSISDYKISIRDGVAIDKWGVAKDGHKYDFQVVETDVPYYCILEWSGDDEEYKNEVIEGLDILIKDIVKHGIQLGARTTRGYGKMKVEVRKHQFDFPNCIDEWLDFNPWSESDFSGEKVYLDNEDKSEDGQFDRIEVQFKVIGSFSIRVNMERIEKAPDSVVMVNKDSKPVVPGTTWAGVFRHHMQEILSHIMSDNNDERTALDCLFGRGRADNTLSRIRFGETIIEGGKPYVLTRNAVERFTQAPKNSALFTDEFWQGGVGTLEIMIDKGKMSKLQRQLLEVSLLDLDNGMLTFGGSTGTGHGRVEVMKLNVNGMDYTENLKSGSMGFLEGLHEY